MGSGRKNKKKSKKKQSQGGGGARAAAAGRNNTPFNFVSSAGPGCYISHLPGATPYKSNGGEEEEGWRPLGVEPFRPEEFDPDIDIPEIALDPDEYTVSVTNSTSACQVCYVTVYDVPVLGRDGREVQRGITIDNEGKKRDCVTFIVLCPATTFVHLCRLQLSRDQTLSDVDIDSDVRDYECHPNPDDTHCQSIGFPLQCCEVADNGEGRDAFLCTQGEGGHLTHYMTGNYHAVDFQCPVGTPCLAVFDGVVIDCEDRNLLTGVAVSNLFKWNSILIKAEGDETVATDADLGDNDCNGEGSKRADPLYAEYVHIDTSSVCVKPGDRVRKGQIICKSGSVGFSPEPHLHFSAFRSNEPTAPTVRVMFEATNDSGTFVPKAGDYYNHEGLVKRRS